MLMSIDKALGNIPSVLINTVTLGSKGSSLCGRLYLYNKYVSTTNKFVNSLIFIIDGVEPGHCSTSARHWRLRHKKDGCYFPKRYSEYLQVKGV